jgi:adenylate kinase
MESVENDEKIKSIKRWLGTGSLNIFGLPFAGKDTHGRELAKLFDAPLIGGGEIIRSDLTPQHMKDHIAKGMLTPTDEYLQLMLPYLAQERLQGRPLILNSVGRWFGEHLPVEKAARETGHDIKAVLYIDIDAEEVRRRWEKSLHLQDRGQRHDDAEHILDTRIHEFEKKTKPVIDYYRQQNLVVEVSGKADRNIVTDKIINMLYRKSLSGRAKK